MSRLPRIPGRELIKSLGRHGFLVQRIRGSHYFLQHPDGHTTVVPVHGQETIGPGLLRKIIRDCELEAEDIA